MCKDRQNNRRIGVIGFMFLATAKAATAPEELPVSIFGANLAFHHNGKATHAILVPSLLSKTNLHLRQLVLALPRSPLFHNVEKPRA